MKYTIKWLLVLLTVLNPILSSAALTDFDRQEIAFKNWLAPYNSGFESGKAKWTASGGTFTAVTSGSNLLVGKGSATWDGSSASQTLTSQTITIEKGYYGQNCEAGIVAQVPSGTATHTVQAYDGTNILVSATIISSTTPRLNTVNFPCPQSGTVALRLVTVASDEPLIAVDDAYLGLARNVGSTQLISEWTSYSLTVGATTTAPTKGTTSVDQARWRRVGDSMEIRYQYKQTGAGSAGSGIYKFPLPSGYSIDTSKVSASAGSDNATPAVGEAAIYCTDVSPGSGVVQAFDSTNLWLFAVNETTSINVGSTNCGLDNATVQLGFTAVVPIQGWAASPIVMPDAQGWYVDASISGTNVGLGTTSVSSYSPIGSSSLTMTKASGSADVMVPCSAGNAPSGLTCSAGSELFGAAFNIPKAGSYRVCLAANHYIDSPAGSVNVVSTFQLVETSTTSDTILQEGKGKAMSGSVAMSGDRREYRSIYTCGDFVFSSVGQKVIKLMYETEISGTPDNHYIKADGDTVLGQPDVHITVYPLQDRATAILANSVSTSATNGLKTESFSFTCSGSSSIAVQLGGTSWVSSIGNISAGVCAVGISAGTFSGSPQCQVTWTGGGSNAVVYSYAETSSGFNVGAVTDTGAAATSFTGKAMCVGPR